jgi:hypothetical protein
LSSRHTDHLQDLSVQACEKTKADIKEVLARQGSIMPTTKEGNHELDADCKQE